MPSKKKGASTASIHNFDRPEMRSSFSHRNNLLAMNKPVADVISSPASAAMFFQIDSLCINIDSIPEYRYVTDRNPATTCIHVRIMLTGNVAPLRNNIGKYSNCTNICASLAEFTTAATITPNVRNATTAIHTKTSVDTR